MSDLSSFLSTRNRDWSAGLWDGLIEAIGARLAPLEEQLGIQREVADAIIARGLTVIEQELAPIVAQADQILNDATQDITAKVERFEHKVTGGTVVSYSTSPASLTEGATINLTVAEADREFFAPTPYLALSRASTVANWGIAKVNSFNRLTGVLALSLEQVTDAGGPFSDWVITSLPGTTLLQKAYYEQTLALRDQVSEDKGIVAGDKTDVQNLKSDVSQIKADTNQIKEDTNQIKSNVDQTAQDVAGVFAEFRLGVSEPLVPPANPVIGQLWYDGSAMRVFDGVGFVPTVTVSIGGRRYEQGTFASGDSGIVTVGGGFTAAMVFLNGALLREGADYSAASPDVTFTNWQTGDEYFIEAYMSTDATDFDTKEQVNQKIENAIDAVPKPNSVTVGAAIAAASGQQTINDADTAAGVLSGTSTLVRWTWGNVKAWIKGWITKSDVNLGNVANKTEAQMVSSGAIADKFASLDVALGYKVGADYAALVGFGGGDINWPYIKHSNGTIVDLATRPMINSLSNSVADLQQSKSGFGKDESRWTLNFPIGHIILVRSDHNRWRDSGATIYQVGDSQYADNTEQGIANTLSGYWLSRGTLPNGTGWMTIYQRVA